MPIVPQGEFGCSPIRSADDIEPGDILTTAADRDMTIYLVASKRKTPIKKVDLGSRIGRLTYVYSFVLVSSNGQVLELEEGLLAVKGMAKIDMSEKDE